MSNDLIQRAEVLRKSLDNGVINVRELQAFFDSVVASKPPREGKGQKKKEERFLAQLARLDSKAAVSQ